MNFFCRAAALAATALFATACEWAPDGYPEFSPDGKKVAYLGTVSPSSTETGSISVQDFRTGQNRSYRAPEGVSLLGSGWDGKSLIVHLKGKVEGLPTSDEDLHSYAVLNLKTGEFESPEAGSVGELANRIALDNGVAFLEVAQSPATRVLLSQGVPASSIFPLGNGMVATLEFPGTEPGRLRQAREDKDYKAIFEDRESVSARIQFHSRKGAPLGSVTREMVDDDELMNVLLTRANASGTKVAMVEPPYRNEGEEDRWGGVLCSVAIHDTKTGATGDTFDYLFNFTSLPHFDGNGLISAAPVEIEGEVWVEFSRWSAKGREGWGAFATGIQATDTEFKFVSAPSNDGKRFAVNIQHGEMLDSYFVQPSPGRIKMLSKALEQTIENNETAVAAK